MRELAFLNKSLTITLLDKTGKKEKEYKNKSFPPSILLLLLKANRKSRAGKPTLECFKNGPLASFLLYFADTGRFTTTLTEVVNARTTYATTTFHFKFSHAGRVHQEGTLYANALENFTHGNGFANPCVLNLNDNT